LAEPRPDDPYGGAWVGPSSASQPAVALAPGYERELARIVGSARRRAFFVVAILTGIIAVQAFQIALWVRVQSAATADERPSIAVLFGIDRQSIALEILYLATLILCGIFFVAWLRQVVSGAKILNPIEMRLGVGAATFGWVVPLLNFVLPFMVVRQATRALDGGTGVHRLVITWWVAWVLMSLTRPLRIVLFDVPAATLAYVGLVIVAGILALLVVRRLQLLLTDASGLALPGSGHAPIDQTVRSRVGWFRGAALTGAVLFSLASLPVTLSASANDPGITETGWVRVELADSGIRFAHPPWLTPISNTPITREDGTTVLWVGGDSRTDGANGLLAVAYTSANGLSLEELRANFTAMGAEVEDATMEDLPALRIRVANPEAGTDEVDDGYVTVWRDRMYFVTFTVAADRADEYRADLARIANSFHYRVPLNAGGDR
jgi:hypothetical protein